MGYPNQDTPRSVYRAEVIRTAVTETFATTEKRLALGAMGLAGEAGEVVDLLKKHIFHGKPLDREKLKLELGDVRWYLESLAIVLDFSMEEIERANIEKLRARFPDGFSHDAANAKADERKSQ